MNPKTCLHCNQPLPDDANGNAKYCGKTCRTRASNERLREHKAEYMRANAEKWRTRTCPECGQEFTAAGGGTIYCEPCRPIVKARKAAESANNRAAKKLERQAAREVPRVWQSGKCPRCGAWFTTDHGGAIYCSATCRTAAKVARRITQRGEFDIAPTVRRSIYERDAWTCQLCGTFVDQHLDTNDPMGATLDHIEPQSIALIPDHSKTNLRLAHRICNSRRGNRQVAPIAA